VQHLMPWRLRRIRDRMALWSMRFVPGIDTLRVADGEPAASLLAVGDIALGDKVEAVANEHGPERILGPVRQMLEQSDLRVGNLESVLTSEDRPNGSLGTFLKASPQAVQVLAYGRFDALTVANNHCMDFGVSGLLESMSVLDNHGIQHCGGGASHAAARRPALLQTKGVEVAMLGYCDDYRPPRDPELQAGPAPACDDAIVEDIRDARGRADIVIVQMHWGYEFGLYPLLTHRVRARKFAEAGAALVLCHHAHVPMGIEVWGRSVIAHGLGNFIFPMSEYLRTGHPWTDRSFAVKVFFAKKGILRVEILPVQIRPDQSVAPLHGSERRQMVGAIRRLSSGLLDDKRLQSVEDDRMARQALKYVEALTRRGHDPAYLQEMAQLFCAPSKREVVAWLLRHRSRAAVELGSLLQMSMGAAGGLAPRPSPEWQEGGVRQLVRQFTCDVPFGADPLGRTP